MRKLCMLLSFLSLFAVQDAYGGNDFSSGDYLRYCQESIKLHDGKPANKLTAGVCLGYVEGSIGMHYAHTVTDKTNLFYCMPEPSVSTIEIIHIWTEYLKKNPSKNQSKPIVTFVSAMSEAFPCKK